MSTTIEILRDARALLSDRSRWAVDDYAYDDLGGTVHPLAPRACRWCAVGALIKVADARTGADESCVHDAAAELAASTCGPITWAQDVVKVVARINDTRGYGAVMRLYDDAIERVASQGTRSGEEG